MASKYSTWILVALAGALLFGAPGGTGADARDIAAYLYRLP